SRRRWGTEVVRGVRARQQFHRTPDWRNVDRGEKPACGRTPSHTRVVLRGTQNQPFHAKIRAKGAGRRWRRVGELSNVTRVGVSVFVRLFLLLVVFSFSRNDSCRQNSVLQH
uniref:Uncharacterized protein n=1 Tax=Aegilops tauschii subsp. strangulata TaxID=200361 RepID=A0A453F450_AEGTS